MTKISVAKKEESWIKTLLNAGLNNLKLTAEALKSVTSPGNARVVTATEVKVLAKGRKDATNASLRLIPTPDHLKGLAKITCQIVAVGYKYRSLLEKYGCDLKVYDETKKESTPTRELDPENPTLNGIILRSIRNPEQKYLHCFPGLTAKSIQVVYVNSSGEVVEISDDEKDAYFDPRPNKSFHEATESQSAAGATKNPEPRDYKLEGLLYFRHGDSVIDYLTEKVKKILDLSVD